MNEQQTAELKELVGALIEDSQFLAYMLRTQKMIGAKNVALDCKNYLSAIIELLEAGN
jgi:hypothetical protein